MATFKCNFNSAKFMKDLERDIKKNIQRELSHNPAKVLHCHVGERIAAQCPCGGTKVDVIDSGRVRCVSCGKVSSPEITVNWR